MMGIFGQIVGGALAGLGAQAANDRHGDYARLVREGMRGVQPNPIALERLRNSARPVQADDSAVIDVEGELIENSSRVTRA